MRPVDAECASDCARQCASLCTPGELLGPPSRFLSLFQGRGARAGISACLVRSACRDTLIGFDEGGRFAEGNLTKHRARLTDCDTVIRLQMNEEIEAVRALREEIAEQGRKHVTELEEAAVMHKEDLK